ncbi:MAG: transposase [Mycobacterium sp.]|nr:transposase [Mycobacterium sp.]
MDELSRRLVPDELWALVEPLIPPAKTRPQAGGMWRVDDPAVVTAIVFVLPAAVPGRICRPVSG